jgi:adenylate kinase family enzyme
VGGRGSVGPTVNAFAAAADLVVVLDYPRRVTLARLLGRWVQQQRVGMPVGHVERPSLFALRFNWTWRREHRAVLLGDLAAAGPPVLRVTRPPRDLLGRVERAVEEQRRSRRSDV